MSSNDVKPTRTIITAAAAAAAVVFNAGETTTGYSGIPPVAVYIPGWSLSRRVGGNYVPVSRIQLR